MRVGQKQGVDLLQVASNDCKAVRVALLTGNVKPRLPRDSSAVVRLRRRGQARKEVRIAPIQGRDGPRPDLEPRLRDPDM